MRATTSSSTEARRRPKSPEILLYEDLKVLSGENSIAGVIRWASSQGIRYGRNRSGTPWSTVTALNFALGFGELTPEPKLRAEDLF